MESTMYSGAAITPSSTKTPSSNEGTSAPNCQHEYLDSVQFAARLNVPPSWVREHVRSRTSDPIPHLKLGKYVRFLWGSPALEAWLKRRMVAGHDSTMVQTSGKERIQ